MELENRASGDAVRVAAHGCRGERAREQELGGGFTAQKLSWLFDQCFASVMVLTEAQAEDEIWEKRGAGLPGTGNFAAVHGPTEARIDALRGGLL